MNPADIPADSELSVGEAISVAVKLHKTGYVDAAETLYRRILEVDPEHPDALHFLGVVSLHRGKIDSALELIQRSIAIEPNSADSHSNLGNVLVAARRVDEAVSAYEKAIALRPAHAAAYTNLGVIFKVQGRFDEARKAYQRALELEPEQIEAHNNYANLLVAQGEVGEAVLYYSKAITLRPQDPSTRTYLALAYCTLGQYDKAAEIYRQWLEEEPDHPSASHLLAACSGTDVPERASDRYIEHTFDTFAATFDAKLAHLEYRAPQLMAEAIARAGIRPEKRLVALDAGCGTGLCGPLIAPYVRELHGVDLSARMLAQAEQRGVYTGLCKEELTGYLQRHTDAFDLIVSADTLVYFGALEAVLEAAFDGLRHGGLLVFSVEAYGDASGRGGFHLNPHGRYSHSRSYLTNALDQAGFVSSSLHPAVLRMENGAPVDGYVISAWKGRDASGAAA